MYKARAHRKRETEMYADIIYSLMGEDKLIYPFTTRSFEFLTSRAHNGLLSLCYSFCTVCFFFLFPYCTAANEFLMSKIFSRQLTVARADARIL